VLYASATVPIIAQSAASAAGGELKTSKLNVSWTLGEVVSETFHHNDMTLTQGYQQSNIEVIALNHDKPTSLHCNVYPNPTNDFIVIVFDEKLEIETKFSLSDANGTELMHRKLEEEKSHVSLKTLAPGSYTLKITTPGQSGSIFRIIKTN
jgi:hypothetical protein